MSFAGIISILGFGWIFSKHPSRVSYIVDKLVKYSSFSKLLQMNQIIPKNRNYKRTEENFMEITYKKK